MTTKGEFNAQEWDLIVQAPALAAMQVIAAERGGTLRESMSLARAYQEARATDSGLMKEIVSSAPSLQPGEIRSPDELRTQAETRLREAIGLLEQKASPEETAEYREFVVKVADTVAHAHREGGFLGIGGKEVSEREQAVLDQIAATVGGGSAP
jgi:hypothetical protein